MDNITEDELNYIAERVLEKLIKTSQTPQWHQINTPMTIEELINGQMPFKETEEEMLIAEMARLTTLINIYNDNEEFQKVGVIQIKLEMVETRLSTLNRKNNGEDQANAGSEV